MKIFVSWSGDRGKELAKFLESWLSQLIQEGEPFISPAIPKGKLWLDQITAALRECQVGVVILTPESQGSNWLNFELGVIHRSGERPVMPLLVGMGTSDIASPLNLFQSTLSDDPDEVFALVKSLNALRDKPMEATPLREAFDLWYPRFEDKIQEVLAMETPVHPARSAEDKLDEVVERLRSLERGVASAVPSMHPADALLAPLLSEDSRRYWRDHLIEVAQTNTRVAPLRQEDLVAGTRVEHHNMGGGTITNVLHDDDGRPDSVIVNFPHGGGDRAIALKTTPLWRVDMPEASS